MERDVLVVGEALVDIVKAPDGTSTEYAGGSAANVAVALSRLGRPVRFATSYADDARGKLVSDFLSRDGVVLATDPAAVERTSTAEATIGSDGAASYVFDFDWRLNPLLPSDVPPLVVHTCSLGAVIEPGADAAYEMVSALRSEATISYDVNARPAVTGTGPEIVTLVERMVGISDLVKASDEDLAALYPGRDLAEAARALLTLGPAAVVVTKGDAGAVWFAQGTTVEVETVKVDVADTIGAGDTFGAAMVDALWERGRLGADRRDELRDLPEDEVAEVLAHAARAAAVTVSRPGADPPYRSELQA
jgi:fructokinase